MPNIHRVQNLTLYSAGGRATDWRPRWRTESILNYKEPLVEDQVECNERTHVLGEYSGGR